MQGPRSWDKYPCLHNLVALKEGSASNQSTLPIPCLRDAGEDVVHLREQNLHRMSDPQILEKAAREQRTVLTCDLDFGVLLARGGGAFPSVILFRTRNRTPASITPKLFEVLAGQPRCARRRVPRSVL